MQGESNSMKNNSKVPTKKINKGEFVSIAAKSAGLSVKDMNAALNAILVSIPELAKEGAEISFSNFGTFSVKSHKGHPVNFESKRENIDSYAVFKFSASTALNKRLRDASVLRK